MPVLIGKREFGATSLCAMMLACVGGSLTYNPPAAESSASTTPLSIAKAREDVWRALIPRLGQSFFVINNLDHSSGFVNVTYSGDPETYVECGSVVSKVRNAADERAYTIIGARAKQSYEQTLDGNIYSVIRTLALSGRANVVLEETGPTSTRVSVNAHYVLTRIIRATRAGSSIPQTSTENVEFNSSERGAFQANSQFAMVCRSNGALERQLLALVNP